MLDLFLLLFYSGTNFGEEFGERLVADLGYCVVGRRVDQRVVLLVVERNRDSIPDRDFTHGL
jgi:hypothetical protein